MTSYFDQRGQTVHGSQINVVADADVGSVSGLVAELERLGEQLHEAAKSGVVDRDMATEAEYRIGKARNEAAGSSPDRGRFLGHLGRAEQILKAGTAAAGFVTALEKVAEAAQSLLH